MKRFLCTFLVICMVVQMLPLTVLADVLDGKTQTEQTAIVSPDAFAIQKFDVQAKSVTLLSPENRSVWVIAAQYSSDGRLIDEHSVKTELVVGINTVSISDFVKHEDTATVKVMLLDGPENGDETLKPLCDSLEIGAETYTIEFQTGVDGLTISPRSYASNTVFGKLPMPVFEEALFIGWFYDKDYTKPVLEDDPVTQTCTLYAKTMALDGLYDETDTVFTERFVANADAPKDTKILILSNSNGMSADDVLSGMTSENLSLLDKAVEDLAEAGYTVEKRKRSELAQDTFDHYEIQQKEWLKGEWDSASDDPDVFVLSANDGFTEGNSFRLTLTDERLSFAAHDTTAREYNLTVARANMSNLSLKDDIIFIKEEFVDEAPTAQLSDDSDAGVFTPSANRFSISSNHGKLVLSGKDGMLEIVASDGTSVSDELIISGDPKAMPEKLNNKTVAVYGQNTELASLAEDGASPVLNPDSLTLADSALWNMDYRTIEGQVGDSYIYTETSTRDILFKPDVFPILSADENETKTITIAKDAFDPNKTITIPGLNETATYKDFGVDEDTTIDVGDFIAFLSENTDAQESSESKNPVWHYAKILEVTENTDGKHYNIIYEDATEDDILSSMDMYGERDLNAEELTDTDDFTEIEKQAEEQALASGFASDVAMYVSSAMVASEAFSDLSKEYGLNCKEIRRDFENALSADTVSLYGNDIALYSTNNVTVNKPKVEATVNTNVTMKNGVNAALELKLTINGDIAINFGSNRQNTITIKYSVEFKQSLNAKVTMSAKLDYHYFFFIPIIDDCTLSTTFDYSNYADATLTITAGLTSTAVETAIELDSDGKEIEVWYAKKYGERYHLDGCSYRANSDEIEYLPISQARVLYLPCERCKPDEKVYITPNGECYHRKNCFYLNDSKANGTLKGCSLLLIRESGNYRPCSRCYPAEALATGLSNELDELAKMMNGIRQPIEETAKIITKLANLEDSQNPTSKAEDAGAAADSEAQPEALVTEKELIDRYQTLLSNSYSNWVELYRCNLLNANVFSFFGIVNVNLSLDFCLYANLNLALSAEIHYQNAKRYIFTFDVFKGELKQSVQDLKPEQLKISVTAMGTAGLKMGVELSIGVNFISDKIGRAAISGELGLYFKLWGYFNYYYLRQGGKEAKTETRCHGALYIEAGPYVRVGLSAVLFGKRKWSPTLYYDEKPVLKAGNRKAVLGFADAKITELSLRRNYRTLVLPSELFSLAYFDLRTGKPDSMTYENELKKSGAARSTAYKSEHYSLIINNDGNDSTFQYDPKTASIVVTPDGEKEEKAELIITYIQPQYAFNRTAITKKVNLYWDNYGDMHTLVFNSSNGSYTQPIFEPAGKDITLPTPERAGYIFDGWYTDEQFENRFEETTMPDVDMNLYAKWLCGSTTYTVNHWQYDLMDIPQLTDTDIINTITETVLTPERKAYVGFVAPEGIEVQVQGDGSTEVNYYYQRKQYVYELNVLDQTSRRMVRYGEPMLLTGRDIAGYDFNGWFDSKDENKSIFELCGESISGEGTASQWRYLFNYTFDSDLSLTAKLTPRTDTPYLIEFYTYQTKSLTTGEGDAYLIYTEYLGTLQCTGTTGQKVPYPHDADDLDLVKIAANYADSFSHKEGFNLEEWDYYTDLPAQNVTGKVKGDGTLVLRAYYKKAERSIDYKDPDGTSWRSAAVEVNKSIQDGENHYSYPILSKTGHTFGGWKHFDKAKYDAAADKKDALVFTAKYIGKKQNDNWTPEWEYTAPNGEAFSPIMPRVPYITEAIITANTYTLTFYNDKNSEPAFSKEVTFGEPLPNITIPERKDYTFEGYYDFKGYLDKGYFDEKDQYYNSNGTAVSVENGSTKCYTEGNDTELLAKWSPRKYNINYELNASSEESEKFVNQAPSSYTVETTVTLPDPSRPFYAFLGWYTTKDCTEGTKIENTAGCSGNLTVYAKWSDPLTHGITYVLNGGDNSKGNPQEYNSGSTTLYAPTRKGYTFGGWELDAESKDSGATIQYQENGNTWILENTPESGNITVEAQWKANTYTVEYVLCVPKNTKSSVQVTKQDGGTSTVLSDSIEYPDDKWTFDAEHALLNVSLLPGYTFVGWYTDEQYSTRVGGTGDTAKNLTEADNGQARLYAKWKANQYTVTYDMNAPGDSSVKSGGANVSSESDKNWKYDTERALLKAPTRTGYTFGSWYKNAECTKESFAGNAGETVVNLTEGSEITLFAKWIPIQYTVLFDLQDGQFTEAVPEEKWNYGSEITVPNPTHATMKFAGWTISGTDNTAYTINRQDKAKTVFKNLRKSEGTVTLTANWRSYKVTLDKDGGTDGTDAYYYLFNTVKGDSNNKLYYYKDASCNIGSAFEKSKISIPSKYNQASRKHDVFDGYYTEKNGQGIQYVNFNGVCINSLYSNRKDDTTLYAKWIPSYKVTLDKCGGTDGTSEYYYLYNIARSIDGSTRYYYEDDACTKPYGHDCFTDVPTRAGCAFGGYFTAKNGQGQQYIGISGQCINNLYAAVERDIILYAYWKPYTITFDGNGGTPSQSSISVTSDSNGARYAGLPTATRSGYIFVGWYTAKSGGTKINEGSAYQGSGNRTLYAHWAASKVQKSINGSKDDKTINCKNNDDPNDGNWIYDKSKDIVNPLSYYTAQQLKELKLAGYNYFDVTLHMDLKASAQACTQWVVFCLFDKQNNFNSDHTLFKMNLCKEGDDANAWKARNLHFGISFKDLEDKNFGFKYGATGNGASWTRGSCKVVLTPTKTMPKNRVEESQSKGEFNPIIFSRGNVSGHNNDLLSIGTSEQIIIWVRGGSGNIEVTASISGCKSSCLEFKKHTQKKTTASTAQPYHLIVRVSNDSNAKKEGQVTLKAEDKTTGQTATYKVKWSKR